MQREYRQDIVQPDSYPPLLLHLPPHPPPFLVKNSGSTAANVLIRFIIIGFG